VAVEPTALATATKTLVTRKSSRKSFVSWLLIEAFAVVVAAALGLIALGHVAETNWAGTFLYNADSLALPLMKESILRGEPFHWIFSSQNYLFPEAPIYFLSALFAKSARVAMYINGCLNIVILYALFRSIARQLAHRSRHRFVEITIAIAATFAFVVFVLLEPAAEVNGRGIATLFLFSTYYDGVILSGLAVIALSLWLTRAFGPVEWGRHRVMTYGVAVVVLTSLTAFSDPLYLLQLVAPLAAAALVLVFLGRLTWRGFWILAVPTTLGTIVAVALRAAFSNTFASSIGGYISFPHIPDSLHVLFSTAREMLHTGTGALAIILLGGLLLVTACVFVFATYAQARPRLAAQIATSEVFIVTFVSASTISLITGMVITGSTTTRYLEPIYVFPILTLVTLGVFILRRLLVGVKRAALRRSLSRFAIAVAAVGTVLFMIVGAVNVAPVATSASGKGYTGEKCFDSFVGTSKINGVGSYWSVRPLALYGDSRGAILQADDAHGNLEAFAWINNLGAYVGKKFSFVITDSSNQIGPSGIQNLGRPSQVVSCPGYLIYDYSGTHGQSVLNKEISASVRTELDR
jgi:hypothetical protein